MPHFTSTRPRTRLAGVAFAAAAAVFAMAAPALAARAETNVNVRNTPGGRVVDVLRTGEQVDIVGQRGGWCQVRKAGPDGWVACRYLTGDRGRGRGGRDERPRRDNDEPDVNFSFSIPGFGFSFGNGGFDYRPDRPGRPHRRAQACFYEDVNYRGARFCERPGARIRSLGQWNDRISSIRLTGGAEVRVCEDFRFDGRCVTITRSVNNLGRRGNDRISSIRVR